MTISYSQKLAILKSIFQQQEITQAQHRFKEFGVSLLAVEGKNRFTNIANVY